MVCPFGNKKEMSCQGNNPVSKDGEECLILVSVVTESLGDATKCFYLSEIICQTCNKRVEQTEDP